MTTTLNRESIRATFQEWNAERSSLDAELSESLAALEAYQQHLDEWQRQLAAEREKLKAEREQFAQDQAAAEKTSAEASAESTAELQATREKVASLTALLLSRTEELRTLDNRRAEVQTELELSRARERELKTAFDDHKRLLEQERSQWSEELEQVREVLERQIETPAVQEPVALVERPAPEAPFQPGPAAPAQPPATNNGSRSTPRGESPVLGSIVEQFGKLRQQRAVERQSNNRQR